MTDAQLIVALVTVVLTALPNVLLAWATLRRSTQNAVESAVRGDAAAAKMEEVHAAVNGNLSAVKQELAGAKGEIRGLLTAVVPSPPGAVDASS